MSDVMRREVALAAAERVIELLKPQCERIEIAGSIRRGSPQVKDVEIVAIPRTEAVLAGLFGETQDVDLLDRRCAELLEAGVLAKRFDKNGRPAWGLKHKRARFEGLPVDLFMTSEEQWGGIFAIRTGPDSFSRLCVTSRAEGGAMPMGMRHDEGALWRGKTKLPTPTEEVWFTMLGIPCWDPSERSADRLRAYLKRGRW